MGRERKPLNPVEAHRRSQKRKAVEKKRAVRKELLSRTPLARRDPSTLLIEIERLREGESEGRLDGPARLRRKHLEEQFAALNKAREKAGMPTLHLPEFDPEAYRARKASRSGGDGGDGDGGAPQENDEPAKEEDDRRGEISVPWPDDEPYETGAPGLPPYRCPVPQTSDSVGGLGGQKSAVRSVPIIAAESSVSKKARLEAQVDQFLTELDL